MATIAQAAVAASVLVGLVTIPAASKTAVSPETVSEDLPDVSSSDEIPKEVERSTSSDSFSATVKTAFNQFATTVEHDSVEASLENANSELEVDRSPSETRWTLTTSDGSLTVSESGSSVIERSRTPAGTLEIRKENGSRTVKFEGSDRDRVEKLHQQLREMLEQRKQDLEERRQRLRSGAKPDVEVVANESTGSGYGDNEDEHVVVVNHELSSVNLENWKLTDDSDSYTFPAVTLEAGERVKVYSSQEWRGNEGTDLAWNNGGDTATIFDPSGTEIDSSSY